MTLFSRSRRRSVLFPPGILRVVGGVVWVLSLFLLCGAGNKCAAKKMKETTTASSSSNNKATLTFQAQCQLLAEPFCEDPRALREFLERPSVRNLFLSAGGQRPCQVLPIVLNDPSDNSIAELWRQACQKYYGDDALPEQLVLSSESADQSTSMQSKPNWFHLPHQHQHHQQENQPQQDVQIAALATETEAQFPGFKTINTVLNGCQLFPPQTSTTVDNNKVKNQRRAAGRRASFLLSQKKDNTSGGTSNDNNNSNDDDDTNMKDKTDLVYKFHLIGDKKRMVGSAPVVWLVQKLMGDDTAMPEESAAATTGLSPSSLSYRPSETRAISQVSIYSTQAPSSSSSTNAGGEEVSSSWSEDETDRTDSIGTPTVGFRLDIECAVQIEFPKLLLRLLPASRSKVEERGTKAIRKAILQDAKAAIEAIQQAWWIEQEQLQNEQERLKQQQQQKHFLPRPRLPGLGKKS